MAKFIEMMGQPLNIQMGPSVGIEMANYIEKMGQQTKPHTGPSIGIGMASIWPAIEYPI
jgi:hypothetical protein